MTHDILDRVRLLAPDATDLDLRWPADERAELAERIRTDAPDTGTRLRFRPRSRRGWAVAGAAVAAAVLAAVAVPALLPEGAPGGASPAAAAALHRLARIADPAPADLAGPDQFIHTVERERQVGVNPDGANTYQDTTVTIEMWRAHDGRQWERRGEVPDLSGGRATGAWAIPAKYGRNDYLASLPTDSDELERYLHAHASGSNSEDEAVFVAIGDLLRTQAARAALRSAALTVLAHTEHVTLGPATRDALGRPVQEFDFHDDAVRSGVVQSLFFDPQTAQLIDERTTDPTSTATSATTVSEVVDEVPADVLRAAKTAR